ncbi:MAG TPA: hypothetical protein VMG41_14605 [Gemmatimonadales bacterium]|nr:hypothetical protein [Gemmatimonadales bacterium]
MTRVAAPMRLDFAGGWTDVPPFADREGGIVVNAAIDLRVEAEFSAGGKDILLQADDLGEMVRVRGAQDLVLNGRLDLHKAALRMFPPGPGTLRTRSAAPPGSGLGSSGALDVALVAVLAAVRGEDLTLEEVAAQGWELEAVEVGIPGGKQDQYAAALGGFQCLRFGGSRVTAERLSLDAATLKELARHTVICYTGRSRLSGDTIQRVMRAYDDGDQAVCAALRELKTIAAAMGPALLAGDLSRIGALLSANWACQQRLDPAMRTEEMALLEGALRKAGSLGGKAAGAGAGGAMFFLVGDDRESAVATARGVGATVLDAGWSLNGVAPC